MCTWVVLLNSVSHSVKIVCEISLQIKVEEVVHGYLENILSRITMMLMSEFGNGLAAAISREAFMKAAQITLMDLEELSCVSCGWLRV